MSVNPGNLLDSNQPDRLPGEAPEWSADEPLAAAPGTLVEPPLTAPPTAAQKRERSAEERAQLVLRGSAAVISVVLLISVIWLVKSVLNPDPAPYVAALAKRPTRLPTTSAFIARPTTTPDTSPTGLPSETPGSIPTQELTVSPAGELANNPGLALTGMDTGASPVITGSQPVEAATAIQAVQIEPGMATPVPAIDLPTEAPAATLESTQLGAPEAPLSATLEITSTGPAPKSYAPIGRLVVPGAGLIRSVAEKDGYGYVLTRTGLLYTYDLTHLAAGQEIQTYAEPIGQIQIKNGNGLLRVDNTLYAYGNSGIEIFDLSQPAQPALIGILKDLEAMHLLVYNKLLYALGRNIIIVYDITQPLHPIWTQKLHQSSEVTNFSGAINQDMLYVSEYWFNGSKSRGLIRVYRLTLTGEIKDVQRIDTGELGYQMYIVDGKLVRCTSTDVEVWDLSQKDYPRFWSAASGLARVCAVDRGNILSNGNAYSLEQGLLKPLNTFDSHTGLSSAPAPFEPVPYGAISVGNIIFLAQPDQVLILAGQ